MQKFKEGAQIGSYRVIRLLGKGGMGSVYEVEHEKLGVRYALKTFTLEHGTVDLLRKRFLAEGKVLARLRHPNLVRVYDLDYDEKSGTPYFTMDLVVGDAGDARTLEEARFRSLDERTLVKWFEQLASAIDYIHEQGIVHRDIKPGNILIDEFGSAVLTDFGVSRYIDDELRKQLSITTKIINGVQMTSTMRIMMGTREYMSPEVKDGDLATPASDAYSLGLVFFWLLTGVWYSNVGQATRLLDIFEYKWTEAILWLLEKDPQNRPTVISTVAAKLKSSGLVENQHFDDVRQKQIRARSAYDKERKSVYNSILKGIGYSISAGLFVTVPSGVIFLLTTQPRHSTADAMLLLIFIQGVFLFLLYLAIVKLSSVLRSQFRVKIANLNELGHADEQSNDAHDNDLLCPHCGGRMAFFRHPNLEDGQHVRCPYCGQKSRYSQSSKSLLVMQVCQDAPRNANDEAGKAQHIKPIAIDALKMP